MKSLAQAMDEDIDKYMENLPKHPYTEGWPEDRWQEEMEKHPFFMTKPPDANEEVPPLIEGLQQLKYDESENTPDELANTFKNDGNFSFKCKKYRDAIINYTAGLKYDCSSEIKANLYNNRGAANFFLKNYRSALADSERAVKLNPEYTKAKIRIAQCNYFLEKYKECVDICDDLLSNECDTAIMELKKKALNDQKIKERDLRKQNKSKLRESLEEKLLLDSLIQRGIKITVPSGREDFVEVKYVTSIDELIPTFNQLPLTRVHLKDGELIWPVAFLYPVYGIFDCIQEFRENATFENHLIEMLNEKPDWDTDEKYKPNEINVYFQDEENRKFKINMNNTLKQVTQHKRFVVTNGVPLFYILPKESDEENDFLIN